MLLETIRVSTPVGNGSLGILYNVRDDSIFIKSIDDKSILKNTSLKVGTEILRIHATTTTANSLYSQYKKTAGDNGGAFKTFAKSLKGSSEKSHVPSYTIELFVKQPDIGANKITFNCTTRKQVGKKKPFLPGMTVSGNEHISTTGEMLCSETNVPPIFSNNNVPYDIFLYIYTLIESELLPAAINLELQYSVMQKLLAQVSHSTYIDHETNLNELQKVNSQQRTVDLIANRVKDMANQMLSAYNIMATLALDDNWKGIKGRYKELKVVGLEFYSSSSGAAAVPHQAYTNVPVAVAVAKPSAPAKE